MISASYDQGNPLRDAHSGYRSLMRKLHGDPKSLRRPEGDGILHGTGGDSALSGKNGAVCHKCSQTFFFQLFPDICLILCEKNGFLQFFGIQIFIKKCLLYTDWKKVKQDFFQLGSIDGPTVSGKADKETGNDIFVGDLTGRAFQNLLAAVADGDQAAFSRTLCPEGKTVDLLFKLTGQIITESNFCNRILQIFFRKTGSFMRNPDADMRGRGKRISLNMVNR